MKEDGGRRSFPPRHVVLLGLDTSGCFMAEPGTTGVNILSLLLYTTSSNKVPTLRPRLILVVHRQVHETMGIILLWTEEIREGVSK